MAFFYEDLALCFVKDPGANGIYGARGQRSTGLLPERAKAQERALFQPHFLYVSKINCAKEACRERVWPPRPIIGSHHAPLSPQPWDVGNASARLPESDVHYGAVQQ